MNEQGLTKLKDDIAQVEGLTDRFFNRTNVLLDEISILTKALDDLTFIDSQCAETSRHSALTVAQLSTSLVQRI